MKTATFGAGCFWHVQLAFDEIDGVVKTEVGYSGGHLEHPRYEQVCSDETGHVEVCQVTYDEKKVSYQKLLDAFWAMHDPTQENRQGPDVGTQYRSVIFYQDDEQKTIAEKSMKEQQQKHDTPIATTIEPAAEFYPAEAYHQKYLQKKGLKTC